MADPLLATSRDGTRIAAHRSGRGPPLVLAHATSADHTRWRSVLPELERHLTCYAMDRRGRGASGDSPDYALRREAEDIVAVLDAVAAEQGQPPNLLGHSYGGLCALEASRITRNLGRLILYEAVVPAAALAEIYKPGVIERLEALLAGGDREGVLVALMRDVARVSDKDLEALRAAPAWQGRLAAALTIPRELRAEAESRFEPALFRSVQAPTLLLLGGAGPPMHHEGARMLQQGLPNARIAVLPGQGHAAMDTAPALFVREVLAFLLG